MGRPPYGVCVILRTYSYPMEFKPPKVGDRLYRRPGSSLPAGIRTVTEVVPSGYTQGAIVHYTLVTDAIRRVSHHTVGFYPGVTTRWTWATPWPETVTLPEGV